MQNGAILFQTRKAKHKTHHLVLIKSPYQNCTYFYQRTHGHGGEYFPILNTPDLCLQTLDLSHLGKFNNVSEDYCLLFSAHLEEPWSEIIINIAEGF